MKKKITVSIIIRTYNEEKYLDELLNSISKQEIIDTDVETIIVDSGSDDETLTIAKKYKTKILKISKEKFSFGYSLNVGCQKAKGSILVFVSGHCIPSSKNWISKLIKPLRSKEGYAYGRQIGNSTCKFSEIQVFSKYFPSKKAHVVNNFYCNNANAAISTNIWHKYKFNEKITGLEDQELAIRFVKDGGDISYIPDATIYHIHHESWLKIRTRYEREAIAMHKIMPEIRFSFLDGLFYFIAASLKDYKKSLHDKCFMKYFFEITLYRFNQYYGTYIGYKTIHKITNSMKYKYYYPREKL